MKSHLIVAFTFLGVFLGVSPNSSGADFSDTTPPLVTIEEVTGVNPDLNIVLFKIQAQDNANTVSLRDCGGSSPLPYCEAINYSFLSRSQIPPSNIAPICVAENLTRRFVSWTLLASNSQSIAANSAYKHASIFYIALTKPAFKNIPDGCPQWRNDSLQTFIKDKSFSIPTVLDEAGNATEVPVWSALQTVSTLPTSALGMCFIGGEALSFGRQLTSLSSNYEKFTSRFEANPLLSTVTKNTILEKYEDLLKNSKQYARFYQDSFEPNKLNALPACKTYFFERVFGLVNLNTDIANAIANISDKITETENQMKAAAELLAKQEAGAKAAAELKAKQEAEAKAAAELKAKQEKEAKASADLKAKQEAEAKAAAELKAKQEADAKVAAAKKTTITCVNGKLTKKVTAVKPRCPAGYKVKR